MKWGVWHKENNRDMVVKSFVEAHKAPTYHFLPVNAKRNANKDLNTRKQHYQD